MELTRGEGVASFVALDSVREPVYRSSVLRRALLASRDGRLQVLLQG